VTHLDQGTSSYNGWRHGSVVRMLVSDCRQTRATGGCITAHVKVRWRHMRECGAI